MTADAAEDLASRVLGNSGFAPEWVTLNKDIRHATAKWRAALRAAWLKKRGTSAEEIETSWEEERPKLEAGLAEINRKVIVQELRRLRLIRKWFLQRLDSVGTRLRLRRVARPGVGWFGCARNELRVGKRSCCISCPRPFVFLPCRFFTTI